MKHKKRIQRIREWSEHVDWEMVRMAIVMSVVLTFAGHGIITFITGIIKIFAGK